MTTPGKYLFLMLSGLLVWQSAPAQSNNWGLPPSPAGKLAAALLDAVSVADAAVHQQFIEAHYAPAFKDEKPMEEHLKHFRQLHESLAGAHVEGVDMMRGARAKLDLMMKTEAEEYVNLKLALEPGASPLIAGLQVEAADGPPPADRMISTLLATIKASDAAVHQQFIEAHFAPAFIKELPMETHLKRLQAMHRDLAGAEVGEINVVSRAGGDETVTMQFKTISGEQFIVTFDIQRSSPPRLITLNISQE